MAFTRLNWKMARKRMESGKRSEQTICGVDDEGLVVVDFPFNS